MPYCLGKSDFKVARSCRTKLYYKKLNYPSIKDGDEYLKMLANGGYMLEAIAKLLFPEGVKVTENSDIRLASLNTLQALHTGEITLFEATLFSNNKYARTDILLKSGHIFHLIEVKAVSFDSSENNRRLQAGKTNIFRSQKSSARISADWREYLEDLAFQVCILEELFPDSEVYPYLLLPDKNKTTSIDKLPALLTQVQGEFKYLGNVDELRNDHFLTQVLVKEEIELIKPDINRWMQEYLSALQPELIKIGTEISFHCQKCEYRISQTEKNGFRECWGNLAEIQPHIFDLYFLDAKIANPLIKQGKASLFDIPVESLVKKDGSLGSRNQRQRIQIQQTKLGQEWIDPKLFNILESLTYPLHFIDFETATLAIPYHAGMYPYEPIAFQWSCHTIETINSPIKHREWIDLDEDFPNFKFAESLMQQIGTEGTILIWSHHETTILKTILQQLGRLEYQNCNFSGSKLKNWLELCLNPFQDDNYRFVDMCQLTKKHYFHPQMQGKNSIKVVLEAIWKTNPRLQEIFPEYVRHIDNQLVSPYFALPELTINNTKLAIHEGTGAIAAYHAARYGVPSTDEFFKSQWRQLLLQYCHLDTLAMVMVWLHWQFLSPSISSLPSSLWKTVDS